MAALDGIQRIVLLMLENRSFDHLLGHLSLENLHPDVDGLREPDVNPRYANVFENRVHRPFLIEDEAAVIRDPPHERDLVARQLARSASGKFRMSGFVDAYVTYTQHRAQHSPPMGYFDSRGAWMSSFLAREYCVCDRWFTPLPADTQPNRCMAFTGDTLIDRTESRLLPHRDHVFDWLDRHHVRWRVYYDGPPFFLLFGRFTELLGSKYRPFDSLARDLREEPPGSAPEVLFIEPRYYDIAWTDEPANCNHPLALLSQGELLLHRLYTALTRDPEQWARTLLIITYDEHGGFFDHVPPLSIEQPIAAGAHYTRPFTTTGPRVPGLIVSPWVRPGRAFHGPLDHTSLLQLFAEKFGAGPEDYSASVNHRRAQGIRSVAEALSDVPTLRAFPTVVPHASAPQPSMRRPPRSANERAFQKAALELKQREGPLAAEAKYPELATVPPET